MGALLYAYYFSCGCHASSQARAAPRARVYGMWVKGWKKANSLRHARTWQHLRKIMRKSASRQPKARARRKDMAMSSEEAYFGNHLCANRRSRQELWVSLRDQNDSWLVRR